MWICLTGSFIDESITTAIASDNLIFFKPEYEIHVTLFFSHPLNFPLLFFIPKGKLKLVCHIKVLLIAIHISYAPYSILRFVVILKKMMELLCHGCCNSKDLSMEIKIYGYTLGLISKFGSGWSSIQSIYFLFISHQSVHSFLSYSCLKFNLPWKSRVKLMGNQKIKTTCRTHLVGPATNQCTFSFHFNQTNYSSWLKKVSYFFPMHDATKILFS